MIVVGIDPGLTGGVALVNANTFDARVFDMPTQERHGDTDRTAKVRREVDARLLAAKIRDAMRWLKHEEGGPVFGVVEDVHAIEGFSVQTQGSLVDSAAQARAVLAVMRISFAVVNPRRWKGFYGLGSKKSESLKKARALYPDCEGLELAKHEGRAEALLIAHYHLRMNEGMRYAT